MRVTSSDSATARGSVGVVEVESSVVEEAFDFFFRLRFLTFFTKLVLSGGVSSLSSLAVLVVVRVVVVEDGDGTGDGTGTVDFGRVEVSESESELSEELKLIV